MPPDTPAFHRLPSRPNTPASPKPDSAAPVHGLDDDDIQLRDGTSRPTVSVRSTARRAITGRPRNLRHSARNRLRLSGSARTYRWADNPVRGM